MMRVLVVDDSPIIRTSLTKSIGQFSDTVVVSGVAENGVKALEWLERHFADVCVTDIRMPVMDGLTLVKRINERYPWMASIIISSYDEFEFAKQSILLQALDYIMKPIDDALLYETLQKAEERLANTRTHAAAQILLRKLPHNRKWMEAWKEHIRTYRLETFPLLIVDTLDLLEEWVDGRFEWLNALSNLWLQFVIEELDTNGKLTIHLDEGKDLGLGERTLPVDQIRFYFRLCAVRRLEEGAHRLMDIVQGGKDYSNVRLMDEIKRYIQEHCQEEINLQDLADHVALNKSYMSTLFKQETNSTLWNYIVSERMNRARHLLLNTNLKVYEIADQVGYEDLSYFSRLFRKHFGMTPLDYKKRLER